MTTNIWRTIGLIGIAAGTLCAQQGRITGPVSGLVFDQRSGGLRPIIGVPGAGTIGAPVTFAKDLAAAWVAPQLDFAIAMPAGGSLRIYRIDSGAATELGLDGIDKGPYDVVFSPSGTAALLQSSKGMHVVTGLPDAPKLAGNVDVGMTPRNRPGAVGGRLVLQRVAFAVSDDGAYVLSSVAGSVRVLTTSGENRKLADVDTGALVAFAAGSHDAAVADSYAGIILFRDLAGAAVPKVIAPPDSRVAFDGLAFSVDGRRLHAANASAHSVTSFDLHGDSRTIATCDCAPKSLVRMGNVFRLNELGTEPLWLFDADAAEPRIVFVPALLAAN